MRTPSEYTKNLSNGIITEAMLTDALYSVNKRAKNYRNKKREYKHYPYGDYEYVWEAEEKEHQMYQKKERLLTLLQPVCIHREFAGYQKNRVFSYEKGYKDLYFDAKFRNLISWESYYWTNDFSPVHFFDEINPAIPTFRNYLFYIIGDKSFHTPIEETDIGFPSYDLPVLYIDTLQTDGDEINDLMSMQFVDKMLSVIESGKFSFEQPIVPVEDINAMRNISDEMEKQIFHQSPEDMVDFPFSFDSSDFSSVSQFLYDHAEPYRLTDEDKAQAYADFESQAKKKLRKRQSKIKQQNKIKSKAEKKGHPIPTLHPVKLEDPAFSFEAFLNNGNYEITIPALTRQKIVSDTPSRQIISPQYVISQAFRDGLLQNEIKEAGRRKAIGWYEQEHWAKWTTAFHQKYDSQ